MIYESDRCGAVWVGGPSESRMFGIPDGWSVRWGSDAYMRRRDRDRPTGLGDYHEEDPTDELTGGGFGHPNPRAEHSRSTLIAGIIFLAMIVTLVGVQISEDEVDGGSGTLTVKFSGTTDGHVSCYDWTSGTNYLNFTDTTLYFSVKAESGYIAIYTLSGNVTKGSSYYSNGYNCTSLTVTGTATVDITGYQVKTEKADQPTGLGGQMYGGSTDDGQLTGTTTKMEYSSSSSGSWTVCSYITKVSPGKYYVRTMETLDKLPSDPVTVYAGPTASRLSGYKATYNGDQQAYLPKSFLASWITVTYKDGEERKDVGTYTAYVKPIGGYWGGTTEDTETKTVTWQIVQKKLVASDFKITYDAEPYNGQSHKATVGLASTDFEDDISGNVTLYYNGSTTQPTDVGTYPVSFDLSGATNFEDATGMTDGSWVLTISAIDLEVEWESDDRKGWGTESSPKTYDTVEHALGATVKAQYGNPTVKISYTWTFDDGTAQATGEQSGTGSATLDLKAKHVRQSGKIVWTVDAGANYNAYDSTDKGTDIVVKISQFQVSATATGYSGDYDKTFHGISVGYSLAGYSLAGTDESIKSNVVTVKYGSESTSITGDADSAKYKYWTNGPKDVWYKLEFVGTGSDSEAGDYKLPDAAKSTVEIKKYQLQATLKLDDTTDPTSKTFTYDRNNHTLSVIQTNIISGDEPAVKFENGATTVSTTSPYQFSDAGTYNMKVTISPESGKEYSDSYTPCVKTITITVNPADPAKEDLNITYIDGMQPDETNTVAYTYDGECKLPSASWNHSGDQGITVETVCYVDEQLQGEGAPIDYGTYQVYVKVTSTNTNYNNSSGKGLSLGTISIAKKDITNYTVTDLGTVEYNAADRSIGVKVQIPTNRDTVKITYTWTYHDSSRSQLTDTVSGAGSAEFSLSAKHVNDSGTVTWKVDAGDNYNALDSATLGKSITVDIQPYGVVPSVQPYSGDYNGQPHSFSVTYTLPGNDEQTKTQFTQVLYCENPSGDWETTLEQTYCTGGAKEFWYKIGYKSGTTEEGYGDYTFPDPAKSTIKIDPIQLTGTVSLDGDALSEQSAYLIYDGRPHAFSARATNPIGDDQATVAYLLDGNAATEDEIASAFASFGSHTVTVRISAPEDKPYASSYKAYEQAFEIEVGKAPVSIVGFAYDTVTEGEDMAMRITLQSAGRLTGDIVITYAGAELESESCVITDNGDGTFTATVVYDTSSGIIPSGTLQTISVAYPGDPDHNPSDPFDCVIRIRSAGMPVIPEEGGEVPIDPDVGRIEIETPSGDIGFDVIDQPVLEEGDTIVIDVAMRYASEEEQVPGAERTAVLVTEGYVLHSDGSKTPIKYKVTPSVNVDVPSGKKPVVTLYDADGSTVGTPDVLTYSSNSATFRTDADGSLSLRIGVTFESEAIPDSDPDEPIVPEYPQEAEEDSDYTMVIIAGCIVVLLAILFLVADSRGRK